ncbi:MAG TPA: sulfatase-like hydrolase/transferase [Thermoanaerobaculia bacterium]|nr:sulfatase-like hydrolase/transferase [Thermoanaerobaculia bacterium]
MPRILIVTFAVVLALGACNAAPDTAAPPGTPVILISIDTLRSDRLPAYGYPGIDTPNLDRFRSDSILYERAYTHCPLTFPAHASMLTGLLPADHGVRDNVGYRVDASLPLLPELLRAEGYATGAAISAFVLRRETGLDRGFDHYDDRVDPITPGGSIAMVQRGGADTIAAAREWIGSRNDPFFYFLHLYEPHTPWEPPEPFRSRYPDPYDGEIAYVDHLLGGFFGFLREKGLYDRALIIVVSDHGEGLNDHGEEEHGMFLYREAIQIPLLVKLPQGKLRGTSVAAPAQLVDLFPTILELTGARVAQDLPGISLLALRDQEPSAHRAVYSETYYSRFHFGWSDLHSLIDGEYHYIQAPKPELYHVASDPAERQNVLREERRVLARMRRAIEPLVREAEAPAAVDPEEAAQLAALGYLGSTVTTAPGEELADPKDKLATFREIRAAFGAHRAKRQEEALEAVERLLGENSRMLDLWDLKSKALHRLGRLDEAIAAAREGIRLAPNADHLILSVANMAMEKEDLELAEQHARLVLERDPAKARDVLARIWLARGDLDRAEKEARLALEAGHERATAWMTLARIEKERGRFEEALAHLDKADEERRGSANRQISSFHFLRGDVLARLGRVAEAEREFRREIEMFPEQPQAYKNLILLLVTQGRIDEGTGLIHELIRESPTPPGYLAVCQVLDTVGDQRGVRYWAKQGLRKYPDNPDLRRFATG